MSYKLDKPDAKGNYEVTHSSAVFVFDRQGHARLLFTPKDAPDAWGHDLRRLIAASGQDQG